MAPPFDPGRPGSRRARTSDTLDPDGWLLTARNERCSDVRIIEVISSCTANHSNACNPMKSQWKAMAMLLMTMQAGELAADYGNSAVQFARSRQSNTFEMSAIGLINVPELSAAADSSIRSGFIQRMQSERGLYIQGGEDRDFDFHCETELGRVTVKMHWFPASESANCGLFPGGKFDVMVNGRAIVEQVRWDTDCAPSIRGVTLAFAPSRAEVTVGIVAKPSGVDYDVKECSVRRAMELPIKPNSVFTEESLRRMLARPDSACHEPGPP